MGCKGEGVGGGEGVKGRGKGEGVKGVKGKG